MTVFSSRTLPTLPFGLPVSEVVPHFSGAVQSIWLRAVFERFCSDA